MSTFKVYALMAWLFLLFGALTFSDKIQHHLSKRKAERFLG